MSDTAVETMKRVRAERGVRPEVLKLQRQTTKIWKALRAAFDEGPATVPELAERTGLDSQDLFWHLNALRKYGEVEILEPDGDYLRYRKVTKD